MNTATQELPNADCRVPIAPTSERSPEVVTAFADLDRAREALRFAEHVRDLNVNGLRRFAYRLKLTRKMARAHWRLHEPGTHLALIRAELEHDRALRAFRRVAMVAALTKVIDTDRRIKAGQPLAA